jgi:hypothetical protein
MRDIASARLLYERAARMRETAVRHCEWESFDPAFLDRIGFYQWPVIASALSPGIAVPASWAMPRRFRAARASRA